MTREEAWAELGVDAGAPAQAIRAAYLTLLRQRKPDQDPVGFQKLREAYELLRAPVSVRASVPVSAPVSAPVEPTEPTPAPVAEVPPDAKAELRTLLEMVGPDAPHPVTKIQAIDALLASRPEDLELVSWLIREMFLTGLFQQAIAEAHRVPLGDDRWRVETEPVWVMVADLFPEQFNPVWLERAAKIESAILRVTVAEALLRLGRIAECFEVMTRLLELPRAQVAPVVERANEVLMVLVVAKPKRAAPLVEKALDASDAQTSAALLEVRDNSGARWLPEAVQYALADHLRLVQLPPNALAKLPVEATQLAPVLTARIRAASLLPIVPRQKQRISASTWLGIVAMVAMALARMIEQLMPTIQRFMHGGSGAP